MQNQDYGEKRATAPEIMALSAASRDELKDQLTALYRETAGIDTSAFSRRAEISRAAFSPRHNCRMLTIVEDLKNPGDIIQSAAEALDVHPQSCWNLKQTAYGEGDCPGAIAFAFPGQGSQYLFMGRDLARCFPEMGQSLAAADRHFNGPQKLADYVYPVLSGAENEKPVLEEKLRSTDVAQPAIGAVSAGMVSILKKFSIVPDAACGHSYGELSALYAGGRFDESTFFSLSAARGKYMAAAGGDGDKGGMLAVKAPLEAIHALIKKSGLDLILANQNSPDQGVLSGPTDAIEKMAALCRETKIRAIILPVAAAFHSRLVAAAAVPFEKKIHQAAFSSGTVPCAVPVYSNTTALPYPDTSEDAKKVLATHLTHPVNFVSEIQNMYENGIRTFVETGPRTVLTGLIKTILKNQPAHILAVDAASGRHSGILDLAKTLCALAALGYPVALEKWKPPFE